MTDLDGLDGLTAGRLPPGVLDGLTVFPRIVCADTPWERVGPGHMSGVVRDLAIHPSQPERLFAAAANGGIWRLNDVNDYPNTEWEPLTDALDSLRVRRLAIAPSTPNVLYAATSLKERHTAMSRIGSEVLRSDDGGSTWSVISRHQIDVVNRLVIHPADPDRVFAATGSGLWEQTSIGAWKQRFNGDCADLAMDPADPSIIFIGIRGVGVFRSTDAGQTWPPSPTLAYIATNANNRTSIHLALGSLDGNGTPQTSATRTVAARFGDEVNVSDDGGANWRRTTITVRPAWLANGNQRRSDQRTPIPDDWTGCVAVDPFDPAHIMTGSISGYASRDGGSTWTQVPFSHHEDHHNMTFDPATKNRVFCATYAGAFSSIDGGDTWPQKTITAANTSPITEPAYLARGLENTEFRRFAVRNGVRFGAVDHLGLIASDDSNDLWRFLISNLDGRGNGNVSDAHTHENSFVFACPASSDRFYLLNWDASVTRGDPTGVRGRLAQMDLTRTGQLIDARSSLGGAAFLSTQTSSIDNTSLDLGNYSPEDMIYNRNMPGPFAIRYSTTDDERLIMLGIWQTIPRVGGTAGATVRNYDIVSLRLPKDGTTVTSETIEVTDIRTPVALGGQHPEPFTALVFDPADDNIGYACTASGRLLRRDFSDTAGRFETVANWDLPPTANFVSRLVVGPGPAPSIYLLTQDGIGRFNATTDTVETVHQWPDPEERLMSLVAHPTRTNTMFLGTSRGIYVSDLGATATNWRAYSTALPSVPVTELTFDNDVLYAATFGRGLWRCTPCPATPVRRPASRVRLGR